MKRYQSVGALFVASAFSALGLLAGSEASAADRPEKTAQLPAILASLDAREVTVLDDRAAQAVRGQGSEYRYVLVRILGLNTFDIAPALEWTWDPFGYRYGAWGGPGWTNGGTPGDSVLPADAMDGYFRLHDLGALTDVGLVGALRSLPNADGGFWGLVYVPTAITAGSNLPVGQNVWVSGASLIGGRFFLGWRPMPFTEYARREALTAMQLLVFLR
jgi:hypothetical protein